MRDNKEKTYEDVWKEKEKFDSNYNKLNELYKYQRYHKTEGYDQKIIQLISDGDSVIKSEFMEIINWIALWKTDRIIEFDENSIHDIQKKLNELKKASIEEIEANEYEMPKEVFGYLLTKSNKGIKLAMASTIMHFYRPDCFPIIDKRAYRAINSIKIENGQVKCVENGPKELIIKASYKEREKAYFEYINKCKEIVNDLKEYHQGVSMENIDKFLYQIDKYTNKKIEEVKIQ